MTEPTRDQRSANASYYRRNRASEIARVRRRQDATRDFLRRLRDRPCTDCGGSFLPHQMDFDHRDPSSKSFRLTSGRAMLADEATLLAEAMKCDVVCANCHRMRTQKRHVEARSQTQRSPGSRSLEHKRAYWRTQASLLERLKRAPCADCGKTFPACSMDFDHIDSTTKRYTVSRMIGRAGTAKIIAEVAKCDIVCANCHRDRTNRRQGGMSIERE